MKKVILIVGTEGRGQVSRFKIDRRRLERRGQWRKGLGYITLTRDANEKVVRMQYDAFGRLTNTVDAIENTISFEYDANGNQTALIDGEDNRTEFTYDGLNRKTHTTYPLENGTNGVEVAEYDLVGNRTKRTDCNGGHTRYYYDSRNRLEGVIYLETDNAREYRYDLCGNLTNVTEYTDTSTWSIDSDAGVSYSYDALNRVTSETSVGVTHQYAYDLNGNRTNAVYGVSGRVVDWKYDALNRITEIGEHNPAVTPHVSRLTHYAYDLNSKPVYRKYPSGVEELRTFDAMGRLLTMETTLTNHAWFSMAYEYDAVGSARQMVQDSENLSGATNAVTTWQYDARYRLTSEEWRGVSP